MVHVELSGEEGRCWGGEQSWEEMSVFSQVEVSEGGERDHITGSLEVLDGREVGPGKTLMGRSLLPPQADPLSALS